MVVLWCWSMVMMMLHRGQCQRRHGEIDEGNNDKIIWIIDALCQSDWYSSGPIIETKLKQANVLIADIRPLLNQVGLPDSQNCWTVIWECCVVVATTPRPRERTEPASNRLQYHLSHNSMSTRSSRWQVITTANQKGHLTFVRAPPSVCCFNNLTTAEAANKMAQHCGNQAEVQCCLFQLRAHSKDSDNCNTQTESMTYTSPLSTILWGGDGDIVTEEDARCWCG
jgi:hypothetical protein